MAQQEISSVSKEPEHSNLFLCQAWNVNLNDSQLKPSVATSVEDYLVLQHSTLFITINIGENIQKEWLIRRTKNQAALERVYIICVQNVFLESIIFWLFCQWRVTISIELDFLEWLFPFDTAVDIRGIWRKKNIEAST